MMYFNLTRRTVSMGGILFIASCLLCAPAISNTALPTDPSDTVAGLQYAYYEGVWAALPDFSKLTPVEEGTIATPDITRRHRETDFAFSFTGYLNITTNGLYTFYANSDDGSRLLIDNKIVVSNDTLHEERERSGKINLTTGKHAITILYFQHHSLSALTISYAGPGLTKQIIPGDHFSTNNSTPGVRLEAETAKLSGVKIMSDYPGFTGSGFVNYQNNSSDFIQWTAYVPTDGTYKLTFRYSLADATRGLEVRANDRVLNQSLTFATTSGWANWSTVAIRAHLVAGLNTISTIANGSLGPHIDHLIMEDISDIVTGNEERADTRNHLNVFPNPVAQQLFVDIATTNNRGADVSLLNIQGDAVTTQHFDVRSDNTAMLAVDVSTLANGVYRLRVKHGGQTDFRTIVVFK